MSWPYTSCGNLQVNRDTPFAALLLFSDPSYPHPCCSTNMLPEHLVAVTQHL